MICVESLVLTATSLELSTKPMVMEVVLVAGEDIGFVRVVKLSGKLKAQSLLILMLRY
jgi:hypothetical protein